MYCEKCGKQIDDESLFCIFCGAKIGIDNAKTVPIEEQTVPEKIEIPADQSEQNQEIAPSPSEKDERAAISCEQCGALVKSGETYCRKCGARVRTGSKRLYFCENCYRVITKPSSEPKQAYSCKRCGTDLAYKGEYDWEHVSDSKQEALISKWKELSTIKQVPTTNISASTVWISTLRTLCWLVMIALAVLGGVLGKGLGDSNGHVVLGVVIGLAFGFVTVSVGMVLLDMAEDIRAIRNKMAPWDPRFQSEKEPSDKEA